MNDMKKLLLLLAISLAPAALAADRFVSVNQIRDALFDVARDNGLNKQDWPKVELLQDHPRQWKLEYPEFTLWFDCERKMPWRYEYTLGKDTGSSWKSKKPEEMVYWEKRVLGDCQMQPLGNVMAERGTADEGKVLGFAVSAKHFDHHFRSLFAVQTLTNRILVHQVARNGAINRTEEIAECSRNLSPTSVYGGILWSDAAHSQGKQIAPPSAFWKVIVANDHEPHARAWIINNDEFATADRLDEYTVSISDLEAITGIPIPVPNAVKRGKQVGSDFSPCLETPAKKGVERGYAIASAGK